MKDKTSKNISKLAIILSVISVCCVIGGTYAWFSSIHRLNSISLVQVPSKITISGSNRSEMTRISLELTEDDTKENNTVTINRVFCIESTDDFYLEVAHTSNISNMQIKVFPVSVENSEKASGTKEEGWISAGDGAGVLYYKPDSTAIGGVYMNKDGQIASSIYHSENYEAEDVYQENAEPLYWITYSDGSYAVEEFDMEGYSREGYAEDGVTKINYRYYVLQLSWDSETLETDMVYLMASHREV